MSEQTYSPEKDIFDIMEELVEPNETENTLRDKRESERRKVCLKAKGVSLTHQQAFEGFKILAELPGVTDSDIYRACDMKLKEMIDYFEISEEKARKIRHALKFYSAENLDFPL